MVAGQGVPRGQARPVEGGYMVKGPWGYGSTIYHADYAHCGCIVMIDGKPKLDESGAPFALLTHLPTSEIELTGNWDTLGLRATGSFDYKTKAPEVFVPEYMTYAFVGSPQQRGGNQLSRHHWADHVRAYWMGAWRHSARARRDRQAGPGKGRAVRSARRRSLLQAVVR